jgi:hypothetical protein
MSNKKKPVSKKAKKTPVVKKKTTIKKEVPVLSTAYNCIENTGDLKFYLLEIGRDKDVFEFDLPPASVAWRKPVTITELKTQGNISQPLFFALADNKRLSLSRIIFDQTNGSLPHEKLEKLQAMQLPLNQTLRVYQLLTGNKEGKQFAARSYGKFVISAIDIAEQQRDSKTGKTLRAIVNLELTEISNNQLDFGKDLAIPRTIVPTLPSELTGNNTSASNSGVGALTPSEGNVIKAGSVVALLGAEGVPGGKTASHLHLEYIEPGKTIDQTAAKYYSAGNWPKFVTDTVSLGPWKGRPKTKVSDLKLNSPLKAIRSGVYAEPRPHRGIDVSLVGGIPDIGCPISINQDMYFEKFGTYVDKKTGLKGTYLILNCEVPGYAGRYKFLHISALGPDIDTTRKKALTAEPTNKGGKTPTANKKQNIGPEK